MNELEIRQRIVTISEMERVKREKTIEEWCDLLDMSPSSYKRSISLEKEKFDLFKLIRLCEITGYSLDDLVGTKQNKFGLTRYQMEMAESIYYYIEELKKRKE